MPTDETTRVIAEPPLSEDEFYHNLNIGIGVLSESTAYTTKFVFAEEMRRRGASHFGLATHEIFRLVSAVENYGVEETRQLLEEEGFRPALAVSRAEQMEGHWAGRLASSFWYGSFGRETSWSETSGSASMRRHIEFFLRKKYSKAVLTTAWESATGAIEEPDWDAAYTLTRLFTAFSTDRFYASAFGLLHEAQTRFRNNIFYDLENEAAEIVYCECGNVTTESEAFHHDGAYVCESCAEELGHCGTCGDSFWAEDMSVAPDGEPICDDCRDRHTMPCESCGELVWTDSDFPCPSCGHVVGDGEESYDGEFGELIMNSYSWKPEARFHRFDGSIIRTSWGRFSEDDGIYMGVELELNCPGERDKKGEGGNLIARSDIMSDYGFIYAKSDCSVSGPEIVSHPGTLDAHRHLWEKFPWRGLAVDHGWTGWRGRNAGIHIHIDRQAFKDRAHLARFQIMFGSWQEEVVAFAGRNCSSYGYFGYDMQNHAVSYAKGERVPPRGSAINYLNSKTVEVRVFRSSLRKETLLSYLEFLHGLVTYSGMKRSYHIANENAADFYSFFGWLQDNGNYTLAAERFAERIN